MTTAITAKPGGTQGALSVGGVEAVVFDQDGISKGGQPAVRQTVLNGPVDTNGFAAFGGGTGSTTVTAAGTLVATAVNGTRDRIGAILNPSWSGLSTNGTMFLYLDIAADGTCTPGSTTLAPTYRWGGTDVVGSGQFTFNIQEMQGKVGNGSAATQTYRVFVGEVTVAGGVVTAIVWYALMGRYDSGYTATLPSTTALTSKNSNLGVVAQRAQVLIECTTTDKGYAVGDVLDVSSIGIAANNSFAVGFTTNVVFMSSYAGALLLYNKGGGAPSVVTSTSWKYKLLVNRGW
jgi:hypothetical protein